MLYKYGIFVFWFEVYLGEVVKYLGVYVLFILMLILLIFVIWSDCYEDEYNYVVCLFLGELDMNVLLFIDELVSELLLGKLILSEVDKCLNEIDVMGSFYGKWVIGVVFVMVIGVFVMLMGVSWSEIGWLGVLGIVVYYWILWV